MAPLRLLVTAALVGGCARPTTGTPVRHVPERGAIHGRATTAEPGGVRVLLNGRVRDSVDGAWLAGSRRELKGLWRRVGGEGEPPAVDFATHVVLGTGFGDGPCRPEVVAIAVDEHDTVRMETQSQGGVCIALLVRVGLAVAVPRRILPEELVWVRGSTGHRFTLPPPGAPLETPAESSLERESIDDPRGRVALPPIGRITLGSLDDGRQVWVARHQSGEVSVVLADLLPDRRRAIGQRVQWEPRRGRFSTGHDSRGRAVDGGEPLPVFRYAIDGDEIVIGAPVRIGPGPILPVDLAPDLRGSAHPYDELETVTLDALPEGRIVRVGADLVYGVDGPPRLCTPPEHPKLQRHWLGCDQSALPYAAGRAEERPGVTRLIGPLVVRRRGAVVDLVIGLGGGYSGGVREHRIEPPAPSGRTRARGRLTLGQTVHGDTSDAQNGFEPPCVAAPGAPDEGWTLTVDEGQRVAFELESEYDGALAVVDADGELLACNDDRHGHYFSSIAHADLEPGVPVRVIVDGFGGKAGAYELTARVATPPPNGGVLPLGQTVRGDTRGATDDQSSMCAADGPDHALRFEVTDAGRYRFVVDAPEWSPLLAIRPDGRDNVLACGVGQGQVEDEHVLEPGTYWVIVDGVERESLGGALFRPRTRWAMSGPARIDESSAAKTMATKMVSEISSSSSASAPTTISMAPPGTKTMPRSSERSEESRAIRAPSQAPKSFPPMATAVKMAVTARSIPVTKSMCSPRVAKKTGTKIAWRDSERLAARSSSTSSALPTIVPARKKPRIAWMPSHWVTAPQRRPTVTTKVMHAAGCGSEVRSTARAAKPTTRLPTVRQAATKATMPREVHTMSTVSTRSAVAMESTIVKRNQPKTSFTAQADSARVPSPVPERPRSLMARATTEMAVIDAATARKREKLNRVASAPQREASKAAKTG
jgi:hypothetical protein